MSTQAEVSNQIIAKFLCSVFIRICCGGWDVIYRCQRLTSTRLSLTQLVIGHLLVMVLGSETCYHQGVPSKSAFEKFSSHQLKRFTMGSCYTTRWL